MVKRILICYTTLGNGGDLLLLKTLYQEIRNKYHKIDIVLTGFGYDNFINVNPQHDLPLYGEKFDDIQSKYKILQYGIILLRKSSILKLIQKCIHFTKYKNLDSIWKNADLIITCPGGYFHPYYNCSDKLKLLQKAINRKQKCIIPAHSVSPLTDWSENMKKLLVDVLQRSTLVTLREHNQSIFDLNLSNIYLTFDLAFLYKVTPKRALQSIIPKKICINFRNWHNIANYEEKIYLYLQSLINQNAELYYLSTCQGIPGYPDDVLFFKSTFKTCKNLKIRFIDGFHDTDDLIKLFGTFDLVIGMRLHSCIMGLLTNTPVINISYESKGREIFKRIGLDDYCFDLNENLEIWTNKTHKVFKDYKKVFNEIKKAREEGERLAQKNFDLMEKFI